MQVVTRRVEGDSYPEQVQKLQGKTLVNFDVIEVERNGIVNYNYEQAILQIDAPQELIDSTIAQVTEQILRKRKQVELDNIKVITASGKVFYGDPISRADIGDAIKLGENRGQTTTFWKLAEEFNGEKIVEVTIEELSEALELSLTEKARIIGVI